MSVMTLSQLQEAVNRLAQQFDGNAPVEIRLDDELCNGDIEYGAFGHTEVEQIYGVQSGDLCVRIEIPARVRR